MKTKHPLDDLFDVEQFVEDDDYGVIEIPDDPKLDDIIRFSLYEYKSLREIISLIEPKNRIKYYELCEKFLQQAKDAMHKKESLCIARERVAKMTSKKPVQPVGEDGKPSENEDKSVSRGELYKMKMVK